MKLATAAATLCAIALAACTGAPASSAVPSQTASETSAATPSSEPTSTPVVTTAPLATAIPGLYRAPVTIAIPNDPGPVGIADFDGDGDVEVALVNSAGTFAVLWSNGKAFSVPPGLPDEGPVAMATADLNGDGRLDVVLAHPGETDSGSGADDMVILVAKGNGLFTASAVPTGVNATAVLVADLNGDGVPDVATADDGDHVSVFLGVGDATFRGPQSYPTGAPYASGIAAADFNSDGLLDLVTTNSLVGRGRSDKTVSMLLGAGDGTFKAPKVFVVVGPQPILPVVADFNGDGKADVAMPNGAPSVGVTVLLGDGAGGMSAGIDYRTGFDPHSLVAADMDGDGFVDLVAGNSGSFGGVDGRGIAIIFGVGDGTFGAPVPVEDAAFGDVGTVADLDGDGHPDLLVTGEGEDATIMSLLFNEVVR